MYQFQFMKKESLTHFQFIQYPLALRDHDIFSSLSIEVTLLYSFLLNRMKMSISNNWFDKDGNAYIVCEITTIQQWMRCGNKKAIKMKRDLQDFGLIKIKKSTFGADLIYVMDYSSVLEEEKEFIDSEQCPVSNDDANSFSAAASMRVDNTNTISRSAIGYCFDMPECQMDMSKVSDGHANNNDFNNNDFNNNISYPISSVKGASSRDGIRQTEKSYFKQNHIIIDFSKQVADSDKYKMLNIINTNKGIPYEWALEPEKMQLGLQILSCWNDRQSNAEYTEEMNHIYVSLLKNLVDMATSQRTILSNGSCLITYKHVIDHLNKIYHTSDMPQYCLSVFMDRCIDRYQSAYKQREIKKVNAYMKSLIWNTFDSYELDWDGYFNRSIMAL